MRKTTSNRKKTPRYGLLRFFLFFSLFAILVFFFLSTTVGGRFGVFHQLSLDTLGPGQSFFTQFSQRISRFKEKYVSLWKVQEENERLRLEVDTYHALLDEYREAYALNRYLQNELDFKKQEVFPALMARVVGKDPSFWFKTLIVDRGKNDGVISGMVARTSRGVVGQVVQVADNYCKILLANAPSSAIDAIIQKSRVRGILKGAGEDGYILHYVLKNADVSVGDRIVTAGIGGVFPSGITIGTVSEVQSRRLGMFQDIKVKPAVDFARLEFLFINLSEEQLFIDAMSHSSVSPQE